MGRYKGGHNRHRFRMSQQVTYKGERAIVINNSGYSLLKKIMILPDGQKISKRLLVDEDDVVPGWKT